MFTSLYNFSKEFVLFLCLFFPTENNCTVLYQQFAVLFLITVHGRVDLGVYVLNNVHLRVSKGWVQRSYIQKCAIIRSNAVIEVLTKFWLVYFNFFFCFVFAVSPIVVQLVKPLLEFLGILGSG